MRTKAAHAMAREPEDDAPALVPGTRLGAWRIERLVGEGGMGRVYIAEHEHIGRRVALKMLRRNLARNENAVDRFFVDLGNVTQNGQPLPALWVALKSGRRHILIEVLPHVGHGERLVEVLDRQLAAARGAREA